MKRKTFILAALAIVAIAVPALAVNYATWSGHAAGKGNQPGESFKVTGFGTTTSGSFGYDLLVGRNLLVTGILTPSTFAQTSTGNYLLTSANVSVTTPTVAFAVPTAGANYLTLNTDTNQTGCYLTGTAIAEGAVIILRPGSGSNTMRFDDNGTTLALGANITLTEGQDDSLALLCTAVQGTNSRPSFMRLYSADN